MADEEARRKPPVVASCVPPARMKLRDFIDRKTFGFAHSPVVRRSLSVGLTALASLALVAHSLVWNFVTDDAFISFVYARNLARHGQLVFNLGERVEGYTNFLWTVILAGFYKLGLLPETWSRVLGTACAIGTLFLCTAASRWLRDHDGASAWDALPALVLAGVSGFACWSSGGLETQLFALLSTAGMVLYLRDQLRGDQPGVGSAIAFGFAALTRPEGVLLFALTALHRGLAKLWARRLIPSRRDLAWLGAFLVLVVPHLLWRRWYYGWWLPNTFYIKASAGAAAFSQGAYYLSRFAVQLHLWVLPLVVIAALRVARDRRLTALAGYAALIVGVFCLYVASVGGDFMGLYRFMMPIVPLSVLTACLALRALLRTAQPALAATIVALLLVGHVAHAVAVDRQSLTIGADRGIDTPGFLRWYTADRAAIGKWFGPYAQPDDYAAVGGAGAQVYYSGIPSLDCFGLSDAYVAHRVPARSTRPGHQKYAPDEYILSRHPTIITSYNYRIGNAPYVGADEALWRQRGYHYVSVRVPGLSSPWYSFLLRNDRSEPWAEPKREP
jgi:hypothetical protein